MYRINSYVKRWIGFVVKLFGRDDLNTQGLSLMASQRLLRKNIELLYQGFWPAAFTHMLIAIVFVAISWRQGEGILLSGWLSAVIVVTLLRGLVGWGFFQAMPLNDGITHWANLYMVGAIAAGSLWGVAAFLFIYPTDISTAMILMIFSAGISGGAIAMQAPILRVRAAFLLALLLPLMLRLVIIGTLEYFLLGVAVAVFLVALLFVAWRAQVASQSYEQVSEESTYLKLWVAREKKLNSELEQALARQEALQDKNNLLQHLVEKVRDFVVMVHDVDDDGRVIFANEATCLHFDMDKEELYQLTARDFDPNCDARVLEDLAGQLSSGRESISFETTHRVKGGELVPVEVNLYPIEVGGKLFSISHTKNISERREAERQRAQFEMVEAQRKSEARFLQLVEALPDYIAYLDADARYVYATPRTIRALKFDASSYVGKSITELGVTGNSERDQYLTEMVQCAAATGKPVVYQYKGEYRERQICVEIRNVPDVDSSGEVVGVLQITRDIIEQARIDETLKFVAQRGWTQAGESFLAALVRFLGEMLGVGYVIVDRIGDKSGEAETAAVFAKGEILPNVCHRVEGTLAEEIFNDDLHCYMRGVSQRFSHRPWLVEKGIESFIGLSLRDSCGEVVGLIAVMDDKRIRRKSTVINLLQLVATRVAMELEREHSERALKAEKREYIRLLDNSPDIIIRYDAECRQIYCNGAAKSFGMQAPGLKPTEDGRFPGERASSENYEACIRRILNRAEHLDWELNWWDAEGQSRCFFTRGIPEFNDKGEVSGAIISARDISDRIKLEQQLKFQANHDALTGLPNRWMLTQRLTEEIARARYEGGGLALLFIDLDRFKEINDTLGHELGDQLLLAAAQRIQSCVRQSDILTRLGGDEFVAIIPIDSGIERPLSLAQEIIDAMARPFDIATHQRVFITASVGVASYPRDADSADRLLACADQAMYAAKEQGRHNVCFFTPSMQQQAETRLLLINDLRQALLRRQLQVFYQPILDVKLGRTTKVEALLRWLHPERGHVSPADFVPILEESGLIHEVGDWVFREVVRVAARYREYSGDRTMQWSINLSPRQFLREGMSGSLLNYLKQMNLPPASVVIEITEGLLLDDKPVIQEKLTKLRRAGIQVSLDDFGTGYSAMAYLKKFSLDYLKIDRSFVRDMTVDESDRAIAETIVVMAQRLGLKAIAEGVETVAQRDMLADVGCDYMQGYLYAAPMPICELYEYLADEIAANLG